jgi:hypothetical protein
VTEAKGQFALKDLDPDLVFRLLAVADGYTPASSEKPADPKSGPVKFTLKLHELDKRDPALILRGRVLDEASKPVSNAVVQPFGFGKGDGAQFGGLKGFDPLALTDANGVFRIGVPEAGLSVYVHVTAPFMAPGRFPKLATGPRPHDLTLFTGVTITGRLVKNGKPLAGPAVAVVQESHRAETFLGAFQAATDQQGVFTIPNVPPRETLVLYGLMESLHKHGAVGVRTVRTGESRSVVNIGDVEVKPGHSLTGEVVLSDGKGVPLGTRVLISRDAAWDSQQAVVDKEGRFAFAGLPVERYSLSVSVPGYHVSPKNGSYDLLNGHGLLGMVNADTAGLRVLLEPGRAAESRPFDRALYEERDRRRKEPLQGVPASRK